MRLSRELRRGIRSQTEIEVTERQVALLWEATSGRRLEKTRCVVPGADGTVEVDVYSGRLQGLMLAEREFRSESEADAYRPLDRLGEEVTN